MKMQSYLFNTEVINAAHEQAVRDEGISIGEQRGEARTAARYEAQIAQLTAALAKAGILME